MSWWHGARERWLDLVRTRARDRELAEEIRFHLELETQQQLDRGLPPSAAQRMARLRLGDPTLILEATRDQRGAHPLEGSMQDVRWALRSLGKHRGFTLLALVTLALGIGATTAAFSVLDTVLLRPLPYRDADRLVMIDEVATGRAPLPPSFPNFADWRAQVRAFDGMGAEMYPFGTTALVGDEPSRVAIMGVSRDFFKILGTPMQVGRDLTADDHRPDAPMVVVVSHEFWRVQMGGRFPLGTIRWGGNPAEVVGVLPPGFRFFDEASLYFSNERAPSTMRAAHNYRVFGRLTPGVTFAGAQAEMTTFSRTLAATYGTATNAVDAQLTPMRDVLLGNLGAMLTVVFGAAFLVLLIACTNLVSAQLARGLSREREVAMRAALGATRARLIRQLLVESGVLAIGGAILGTALAIGLIALVKAFGAGQMPRLEELRLDPRILVFAAVLTVGTAMLIGVYPATRLARSDPGHALRGGRGTMGRRSAIWPLLVGGEIAMAVMLLVGSVLLIRTVRNIFDADTGFEPRGILTATSSPDGMTMAEIERMGRDIAALPGVSGVAYSTQLPLNWGNSSGPVRRPSDPADRDFPGYAGFRPVTPNYFTVMRQAVQQGRGFTDGDLPGSPKVAIITAGLAQKLWPGENPIGKTVRTNFLITEWLTVVGVVNEATHWNQPRGSQHEIFVSMRQFPDRAMYQLIAMVRTRGEPMTVVPAVRARLRALAPGMAVRFARLEERIERSAASRRFVMMALVAFAGIAMLLAGIGIYGVMSYSVATRTQEIGVRMALGATPGGILVHVLGGATLMATVGIVVGLVGGTVTTRYLQSMLYGVTRIDPFAYGVGAGLLFLTALLGAGLPAWRSSRVDPLVAIRRE